MTPEQTLIKATELVRASKQYVNSLVEEHADAPTLLQKILELAALLNPTETKSVEPVAEAVDILEPLEEHVVPVAELSVHSKPLKIPANHIYVAVAPSDYIDKLTPNGRRLLSIRESFNDLEMAREYGRFATERPLLVGELVREGNDYYTHLKYVYASEV
jgi:hypothetical protein